MNDVRTQQKKGKHKYSAIAEPTARFNWHSQHAGIAIELLLTVRRIRRQMGGQLSTRAMDSESKVKVMAKVPN
jgi:hypothetical protein